MDQTKLIVPRDDIRILELTIDIDRNDPPARGVGWIAFGQRRCPVYCPSMALEWMEKVSDDRPVCAVVATGEHVFGLLCTEATLVRNDEIAFHDLPAVMAASGSPIHRLAIHEGTPACVSSAAEMLADLLSGQAYVDSILTEAS
ncbi:MAG: hypothetical protein Q8O52_28165 [Sulfuritalea sp.]|nr:hypothetical protein [Sulfuritalea sp.]